jgi:small subunit ribosomal protein S1
MAEDKHLNTSFENDKDVDMADLMKSYNKLNNIDFGDEFDVTIIEENADGFMVDLGMKSEGIIPKKEFEDGNIPSELKVGSTVRVKVVDIYGQLILSYKKIIEKSKWDAIETAFKNKSRVDGTITKVVKGGLIVDIDGINAFLPISQIDINFVKDIKQYIDKSYKFIITEFDRKKKNIVVSHRKIIEEDKNIARTVALANISEGQILDGTVSKITNFGAFVDIGQIEGLLHINDIAWYKIKKVEELLHVNQIIKIQVTKVDKNNGKIALSMKNISPRPWDNIEEKFPIGLIVKGTVTSIVNYGVFVELAPGVEGLLHVSEYAWNDNDRTIFKREIKKGQELEVKIINIDEKNKKISLSIKRMSANPWDTVYRYYGPGTIVKGVVKNLTSFGAFIKLNDRLEGFISINNFSWTSKIKYPSDILKNGEEIEVIVLDVNPSNEKISLSLKHIQPDPYKNYKTGSIVKGKVTKVMDFGIFMEIESGIEVLIRNNEISLSKDGKEQSSFKEGNEIDAKIIKINRTTRKIEASIKKLELDREKELIKQYECQERNNKPKLGDILFEEE